MSTPLERRRRVVRMIGYLHFAVAGILALWLPAPAVQQITARSFIEWSGYVWAILLIIGGSLSAWGALWRKWPGEYIGLLALMFVLVIYALAAVLAGLQAHPRSFAGALLLDGVTWILLCRWFRVDGLRREAEHEKQRADQLAEEVRRLKEPDDGDGG